MGGGEGFPDDCIFERSGSIRDLECDTAVRLMGPMVSNSGNIGIIMFNIDI